MLRLPVCLSLSVSLSRWICRLFRYPVMMPTFFSLMLHVAPTNALNVSPVMSISRIDIVSHMCVCGARSRLPTSRGLLPLHFPALSPSCRRKCSGPRVDPPHPSYSNSLLTACQLPLPPSILAAACPLAIFVLHFYIVFIDCGARCVWSITPHTWRLCSS